jgi:hypothetical protein
VLFGSMRKGHSAPKPQPKETPTATAHADNADLADERGSSKCSGIRVIRYISVNPRGLLVVGFVFPPCFLKLLMRRRLCRLVVPRTLATAAPGRGQNPASHALSRSQFKGCERAQQYRST